MTNTLTGRRAGRFAVFGALLLALSSLAAGGSGPAERIVSVLVRALPGSEAAAERTVERSGGQVGHRIGIINGFDAAIPASALDSLGRSAAIHSVTRNGRVRLMHAVDDYDASQDPTSMFAVTQRVTGASDYWNQGVTGRGVDVALIDSGVAPVQGLSDPDKVIYGPDFSVESQAENLRDLDAFGHGTHMAGIIAGRDGTAPVASGDHHRFLGVAPDARIVSIKVADAEGWTDVSQVIAAIDWAVSHRADDGMNIRVLNLSFGTYGLQSYLIDPLAYAAEVAWRKGIVVVVAAGNRGQQGLGMNNPAFDPYVIAVGAEHDAGGTYGTSDATVPEWSSRGDGLRNPDLVAPGRSIAALRVPESHIDQLYPSARVGDRYFRGSGTSQATAVVSGAAALILQQRPSIKPDQLKALLKQTASELPSTPATAEGSGALDLKVARGRFTPSALLSKQLHVPGTGLGSLEQARGSLHIVDEAVELTGEQDIFGVGWNARTWSDALWAGTSWSGDIWRTVEWSARTWSARTWSARTWSARTWSSNTWDGAKWSGGSWTARTWSGSSWSGKSWTTEGWASIAWGE